MSTLAPPIKETNEENAYLQRPHENLKKTGSIEYISKRGYSHSISRLSVEPAAFGTWMKITASEAQSAWVMAGLYSAEVCAVLPRRILFARYSPSDISFFLYAS